MRGKVHGLLGQDLVQAVCNLVGSGFHMEANRHAELEAEPPRPAPSQANSTSQDDLFVQATRPRR